MATGEKLKRDGRPSLLQIYYLTELSKMQPVQRGFQVVIAQKCGVSSQAVNKSLKKAIDGELITVDYEFTEYGKSWLRSYERLIKRLREYLEDIGIPESEREKHLCMLIEDMDPYLVESILTSHEKLLKPQEQQKKHSIIKNFKFDFAGKEKLSVRIALYCMDKAKRRGKSSLSMGNPAFDPVAYMVRKGEEEFLEIHLHEMMAHSRVTGELRKGRANSLKYQHNGQLIVAMEAKQDEVIEYVNLPLSVFKIHAGPGGEIKGMLPITVTCSTGSEHMPESTGLLVFWV